MAIEKILLNIKIILQNNSFTKRIKISGIQEEIFIKRRSYTAYANLTI